MIDLVYELNSLVIWIFFVNLTEHSEREDKGLRLAPKNGFGIWLFFYKFKCIVEGTDTLNYLPMKLGCWLAQDVITIIQSDYKLIVLRLTVFTAFINRKTTKVW